MQLIDELRSLQKETVRSKLTVRSCRDCGQAQRLPALAPWQGGRCRQCGASLRHIWSNTLSLGLALSLASLVMFTVGATNVLGAVETVGQRRTAGLFSGPIALWQHGRRELAALVLAISVAVPLATVGASLYVLAGVRLHRLPPGLRQVFSFRNRLRPIGVRMGLARDRLCAVFASVGNGRGGYGRCHGRGAGR